MTMGRVRNPLKECCICSEISTGEFPKELRRVYPVQRRISPVSENFLAMPSVSPLAPGHVLILPKEHATGFMYLDSHLLEELLGVITRVSAIISQHFGSVYYFEHGVRGRELACGINHAHLHIVPLQSEISRRVSETLRADYPASISCEYPSILRERNYVGPYLTFGHDIDKVEIAYGRVPSQLVRKVIAVELGETKWDWNELYGRNSFWQTCEVLSGIGPTVDFRGAVGE